MNSLGDTGGPPLCAVDDYPYVVQHVQLRRGDRLCMVTDGITEANNSDGDLFGGVRLRAALADLPSEPSPSDITGRVRQAVGAFVAGAEASDDLAVLVLHWIGPPLPAGAPAPGAAATRELSAG